MIRFLTPFALVATLVLSATAAEPSAKLTELRDQRRELDKKIRTAMPDPNKADPELAKLQRASLDASKAYEAAIARHPNLRSYKTEETAAMEKLTAAVSKGDTAAKEAARKEISGIMGRRMEAAAKEPDLEALRNANNEAGQAYFNRRREFLATHPSTRDDAAKLAEVQAAIMEEMKKQREN